MDINSTKEIQEKLQRVVDVMDAICFDDSIDNKMFKRLMKVESFLFKLSYSFIINKEGVMIF